MTQTIQALDYVRDTAATVDTGTVGARTTDTWAAKTGAHGASDRTNSDAADGAATAAGVDAPSSIDALATYPGPAEAGMATAEYAIATLAAVGLAGVLLAILKSEMVRGLLEGIIRSALSVM
jgi:hypothetical protein